MSRRQISFNNIDFLITPFDLKLVHFFFLKKLLSLSLSLYLSQI